MLFDGYARDMLGRELVGFNPYHSRSSPVPRRVTTSMFVDNLVMLARDADEICVYRTALASFSKASGQADDETKMKIVCTNNYVVPAPLESNVVRDNEAVRLLGAYMNSRGGLHKSTWELAMRSLQASLSMLRMMPGSLRDKGAIAPLFALSKLRYIARCFPIPKSRAKQAETLVRRYSIVRRVRNAKTRRGRLHQETTFVKATGGLGWLW